LRVSTRQRSQSIVDNSGTSHVNYPDIKTLKPAEQKGSYTPTQHAKSTVAKLSNDPSPIPGILGNIKDVE